jgi:hypothetical protein
MDNDDLPTLVNAREIIAAFHAMIRRKAATELAPWIDRARVGPRTVFRVIAGGGRLAHIGNAILQLVIANAQTGAPMEAPATLNAVDFNFVGQANLGAPFQWIPAGWRKRRAGAPPFAITPT